MAGHPRHVDTGESVGDMPCRGDVLLWAPAAASCGSIARVCFFCRSRGAICRRSRIWPAHIGGGIAYAALATLAGIGYGAAYHVTQRVEASLLVHFALNLAHLLLFTYPFVALD